MVFNWILVWFSTGIYKYYNGELEETYEYDDKDNIVQVNSPITGGRDIFEYDINGLVASQVSLSGENPILISILGGHHNRLTLYTNDKWGNIIEMKVYDYETNQLILIQKNNYNDKGDEIESITQKTDGSVDSHTKYTYEYDRKGNWITKQSYHKHGMIFRKQQRTISYYSDVDIVKPSKTSSNEIPRKGYRVKRLDSYQLGLLSMAYLKNLFPKPQKDELYVKEGLGDGSCILYFDIDYYCKLLNTIKGHFDSGAFARSNSEDDWNEFMYSVETAEYETTIDKSGLSSYWLAER